MRGGGCISAIAKYLYGVLHFSYLDSIIDGKKNKTGNVIRAFCMQLSQHLSLVRSLPEAVRVHIRTHGECELMIALIRDCQDVAAQGRVSGMNLILDLL